MKPEAWPHEHGWWGTDLHVPGLESIRPIVDTYGCYDFSKLPKLPFALNGTLDWLARQRDHEMHIGIERAETILPTLTALKATCGKNLPDAFEQFMVSPQLQSKVQSNTDCFIDLCSEAVTAPFGKGMLIRFLADSQGCQFWYLYITEDGQDHAVVSSGNFYGTAGEATDIVNDNDEPLVFVAESFESFICRFWLENQIWYASYDGSPLPEGGAQYIKEYRSK